MSHNAGGPIVILHHVHDLQSLLQVRRLPRRSKVSITLASLNVKKRAELETWINWILSQCGCRLGRSFALNALWVVLAFDLATNSVFAGHWTPILFVELWLLVAGTLAAKLIGISRNRRQLARVIESFATYHQKYVSGFGRPRITRAIRPTATVDLPGTTRIDYARIQEPSTKRELAERN